MSGMALPVRSRFQPARPRCRRSTLFNVTGVWHHSQACVNGLWGCYGPTFVLIHQPGGYIGWSVITVGWSLLIFTGFVFLFHYVHRWLTLRRIVKDSPLPALLDPQNQRPPPSESSFRRGERAWQVYVEGHQAILTVTFWGWVGFAVVISGATWAWWNTVHLDPAFASEVILGVNFLLVGSALVLFRLSRFYEGWFKVRETRRELGKPANRVIDASFSSQDEVVDSPGFVGQILQMRRESVLGLRHGNPITGVAAVVIFVAEEILRTVLLVLSRGSYSRSERFGNDVRS